MENLINIGISTDVINEMIVNNGETKIFKLDSQSDNVYKIILVLKELNIFDDIINSLLIYNTDIFLIDYDTFISKLKEYDLEELSERINNNFDSVIDIFLND